MTKKPSAFRIRVVALVALCAAFATIGRPALAQAPAASAAGRWEGAINGTVTEIAITVTLTAGPKWSGTIDIPAQGASDMPLGDVTVRDRADLFHAAWRPWRSRVQGHAVARRRRPSPARSLRPDRASRSSCNGRPIPSAAATSALAGFDEFVQSAMKSWGVPGLAIAIVKDGKVVLAKGYGLRNVQANSPVTADTIFAIGSSTKAFTTMAMGILVEEGKLAWDEPVTKYLPKFALKDEVAGKRMTPRDLVTHRSGLPRHDLVWYNAKLSRPELVARLPYLEPNEDFREKFQYQNLMFLTAGHLSAEVAGTSWEEVIRTRILDPIGMKNSNFAVSESQKGRRLRDALHAQGQDSRSTFRFRVIDTMGPAGSINSSVNDMAKWLQLNLGGGAIDGKRIVAARQVQDMHRPQMVIQTFPGLSDDPEIQQPSYGLGWFIESYRGKKRVHHGGNIDGFSAQVSLLPDDGIGVVVLTNLNATPLPDIVARHASDRLLGLEPIDWNGRVPEAARRRREGLGHREEGRGRGAKDRHEAGAHAGRVRRGIRPSGVWFGDGHAQRRQALTARFHDLPMRLNHWHYETFRGRGRGEDRSPS